LPVGEVGVGATDSDVKDEVELLVEGSVQGLVMPGVELGVGEVASIPVGDLAHVNVKNNVLGGVEVGLDSLLGPNETVDVEVVAKRSSVLVLAVSLVPDVLVPVGSHVQGRSEGITASSTAARGISSRFYEINLSRSRPRSVFVMRGQEPDGRPNPISFGELGGDLHSSVLEGERVHSSKSCAHYWV
jgi:hypothetical protein